MNILDYVKCTGSLDLPNSSFSGGSIDKLSLAGSGDNTLSFSGNESNRTNQNIENGIAQVNEWIDDQFLNTIISGGSLTFKDQNFN